MDEEKDVNATPEENPPNEDQVSDQAQVDVAEQAEEASAPAENASEPAGDDLLSSDENAEAVSEESSDEVPSDEQAGDPDMLSQDSIDDALKDYSESDNVSDSADVTGLTDDPVVRQADFQQLSDATGDKSAKNIDLLMDVELPVSIELGNTRMNVSDILGLGPGSVVELDKLVGEPVDLLVNSKCVARGEVVVVDENFGLRITQLVSPEERIRNLQ